MLAVSNINGSGPFDDNLSIWVIITISSIILSLEHSFLLSYRYSISNDIVSNKSNTITSNSMLSVQSYDKLKNCATDQHTPTTGITYLTHFSCGHVTILKNGTTLRQFTIIAKREYSSSNFKYRINFYCLDI